MIWIYFYSKVTKKKKKSCKRKHILEMGFGVCTCFFQVEDYAIKIIQITLIQIIFTFLRQKPLND